MMMDLHIEFHHAIHIESAHSAGDCHAHGVADEVAGVMIGKELRVPGKDGALIRALDISLDRYGALLAGFGEEIEHHFERFYISGLRKRGSFDDIDEPSSDPLKDVYGICGQQGPDCSATNDQQLRRLDKDGNFALFHQISRNDAGEDKKNSADREHSLFLPV